MRKLYLVFFLLFSFSIIATADNFWTGGDNNGFWNSPGNWTNGVPISTDIVVIDNQHGQLGSVTVTLPNILVTVVSITITPDFGNNITVTLPNTNTLQPGLTLNGPGDVLVINNGGVFKNSSGALAGIPLSFVNATDSIKINNGGRYINNHKAMHSYLVARLSADPGTETGIFEFDIPAASTSLSLSGRKYGTLMLSAITQGIVSYIGSGASDLTVRGDLIINNNVTFSPTLTGNIIIARHLDITGNFIFNPQTNMGSKRSILFNGTTNQNVSGVGTFSLGINFGVISIEPNAIVSLQRGIDLPFNTIDLLINTDAALYAGTNIITGPGRFIQDIGGLLGVGSPDGVTLAPTLLGNIQTGIRIYALGSFEYNGNTAQASGNGIANVKDLIINNSANETVTLSTNSTISNLGSLNLQKGFLKTSNAAILKLSGGFFNTIMQSPNSNYAFTATNIGWEKSFVDGPIKIEIGSVTKKWAPIGKITPTDTLFAPVAIDKFNSALATYTAEYFPEAHNDFANVQMPPLDHVSGLEFWNIDCDIITNPDKDAKLTLSWRPYSKVGNGNPVDDPTAIADLRVAHYYDDGMTGFKWRLDGMNPTFTTTGIPATHGIISTNLYATSFSPFTLATISPFNILPVVLLEFKGKQIEKNIALQWNTKEEFNLDTYEVEKSSDGIKFVTIGTIQAQNSVISNTYNFNDTDPILGLNYYRLKIKDKNHYIYSPIIKINFERKINIVIYPNPVKDVLTISNLPSNEKTYTIVIANVQGQVVKKIIGNERNFSFNLQDLINGVYFINIYDGTHIFKQKIIKE